MEIRKQLWLMVNFHVFRFNGWVCRVRKREILITVHWAGVNTNVLVSATINPKGNGTIIIQAGDKDYPASRFSEKN